MFQPTAPGISLIRRFTKDEGRAKRPIPINPEKIKDRVSYYLFDKNAFPPYGENIFPSTSDIFELINIKNYEKPAACALAAFAISFFADTNPAFAQDGKNAQKIEWAQNVINKVDPIELLLLRNAQKGPKPDTITHDNEDLLWMSRNIGAEAETLGVPGKLGVMISVLERMNNPKFPAEMKAVILQAHQYSWANRLEQNLEAPKVDPKNASLVDDSIFTGMKIEENLVILRKRLLAHLNNMGLGYSEIPIGATDYHVLGMFDSHQYRTMVKSETTKKKILLLQYIITTIGPLRPELEKVRHSMFYIPHLKEITNGKFTGIKNGGMGHIHYTTQLSDSNTINSLFAYLPPEEQAKFKQWN